MVGFVSGIGEVVLATACDWFQGAGANAPEKFWPITLFGYTIQMLPVPLLAFAGSYQLASVLIIVERIGQATRNPPRDAMLVYAANETGYGLDLAT